MNPSEVPGESRYEPPAHQTATFDQAYAGINATIDELVGTYRDLRAKNAAAREIDIAGIAGFLLESPNTREQFVEHFTVAVVRLAEIERQVRADERRQRAEQAEAAVERVRALCARGPGPHNEYQIWISDVLAALDQPKETP